MLRNSVNVIGKVAHNVAARLRVKEFQRQRQNMLKEVATDIKHHRLSSPNHGLCIANTREGTSRYTRRKSTRRVKPDTSPAPTAATTGLIIYVPRSAERPLIVTKMPQEAGAFRMPEIRYKTAQRVAYVLGRTDAPPRLAMMHLLFRYGRRRQHVVLLARNQILSRIMTLKIRPCLRLVQLPRGTLGRLCVRAVM